MEVGDKIVNGEVIVRRPADDMNERLMNLLHTIFHNLKSYTANVHGLVRLLEDDRNSQDHGLYIKLLSTVTQDLESTFDNLSGIIVQTPMVVEPVPIRQVVDKVVKTVIGYGLKPKVEVINKVSQDARVMFSAAYMESVLLNLLTNAVRYSHPQRFPRVVFDFLTHEGQNALIVRDNGRGIDLDRHGKSLFGSGQTFHGNNDANGFGLFLSRYQIEAMGASISVESEIDVGTTFKIAFAIDD